jgi:cytochrome c oxidase subunit 2
MNRKLFWWGLALLALAVAACGTLGRSVGRYASNGERIYFTGTSANGRISYSGGDTGGMMGGPGMMGGQLACADCHGKDGRGGPHVMHMTAMDAPDIRWSTLTEAEHGDHGDEEDEMEHPPYDEETFKQAVTQGLEPGGDSLEPAMPRWRMSEQDLDDLIAYLKTLD